MNKICNCWDELSDLSFSAIGVGDAAHRGNWKGARKWLSELKNDRKRLEKCSKIKLRRVRGSIHDIEKRIQRRDRIKAWADASAIRKELVFDACGCKMFKKPVKESILE